MSKRDFKKKCDELEADGWVLDTYEPVAKFAIYRKNGTSKQVGSKRR